MIEGRLLPNGISKTSGKLISYISTVRAKTDQLTNNHNNNNDILLRTHGPYHRHKSTKSGLITNKLDKK